MFYPITYLVRLLLVRWDPKSPSFTIKYSLSRKIIVAIAILLSIGTATILIVYSGMPKSFNLIHVYDTRERLAMVPKWGSYFMNWDHESRTNVLIIYYVRHFNRDIYHKLGLVFAVLLVGFLYYLTGHKMLYVSLFILITFFFLLKRNMDFEKSLFYIFTALIVSSVIFYYMGGSKIIPSLALRRSFFLPARISFGYHDYFMDQKLYLSHSIFKWFVHTDIPADHAKIIAAEYLQIEGPNAASASANNGIFSDGFKNFGWIGIALWSVIVSIILYIVDRVVFSKDHLIFVPLVLLSLMTWINSALLTC